MTRTTVTDIATIDRTMKTTMIENRDTDINEGVTKMTRNAAATRKRSEDAVVNASRANDQDRRKQMKTKMTMWSLVSMDHGRMRSSTSDWRTRSSRT